LGAISYMMYVVVEVCSESRVASLIKQGVARKVASDALLLLKWSSTAAMVLGTISYMMLLLYKRAANPCVAWVIKQSVCMWNDALLLIEKGF
jgi:hypothetical protein